LRQRRGGSGESELGRASAILADLKRRNSQCKSGAKGINHLARLHILLCHSVGSYVSYHDFINTPYYVITELIREGVKFNDNRG